MSEETYEVTVCCKNCGHAGPLTLPKGTWISAQPCPVCGCNALTTDFSGICGPPEPKE